MHKKIKEYADNGDASSLRYAFMDSLDADPSFNKYEEDYAYAKSKAPDFLEDYEPLTRLELSDKSKWTDEYWAKLKTDLSKNFSEKRFAHMREVAKVVYADRIKREDDRQASEKKRMEEAEISVKRQQEEEKKIRLKEEQAERERKKKEERERLQKETERRRQSENIEISPIPKEKEIDNPTKEGAEGSNAVDANTVTYSQSRIKRIDDSALLVDGVAIYHTEDILESSLYRFMLYSDMEQNEYILRENKETKKLIAFKKLNLSELQKKEYRSKGNWRSMGHDFLERTEYYRMEYMEDDSNKCIFMHLSRYREGLFTSKLIWDSFYKRLKMNK